VSGASASVGRVDTEAVRAAAARTGGGICAMLAVCVCLLLAAPGVRAIDSGAAFQDAALQARYEALIHEFRCVQCQNTTIADSNVGLAADLRREIAEMLGRGQSDAAIRRFMTERYGDFILYDPPLRPRTYLLWAAPALLLLAALAAVAAVVARRSRAVAGTPVADPDDSLADVPPAPAAVPAPPAEPGSPVAPGAAAAGTTPGQSS